MKIVYETPTHKIQIPTGAILGENPAKREADWRNAELLRTDMLSLLTDYPNKPSLMTYRQALRDYPNQGGFPNDARPNE